jgi:acyl-CoA synthetase (AMP-forming)/AMP-acid ligase II
MLQRIGDLLVLNARRYPEKTAVVYQGRRFTYEEINTRVNRLAHHLMNLGVRKGEHVGFMFYNSNQFIELFFATVKIGAVAVPLNYRLVSREIKWALDNTRCRVFAYAEAVASQVNPVKKKLLTVEYLIYSGQDEVPGEFHLESLIQEGVKDEPEVDVGFEDEAYLIFTGGTTGVPKIAVHTHRGSIWDVLAFMAEHPNSTPYLSTLSQTPMFHVAGLMFMRSTIACGGKLVIVDVLDPKEILKLIHQERVTYMVLFPPATYIRLIDVPNFKDFDTTPVIALGTAVGAFPKPLILRILDSFPNAKLFFGFGMTETGNGGTSIIMTRSMIEEDDPTLRSVGIERPFCEVRLVDDNGREVPLGATGEAIIRTPSIMKEYFDQPEMTAQTLKDGFIYTGDLLRKEKDGHFYFMGRKKDMIKTGGENVFAQEVEGVILTHPAVQMCSVIGVPDIKFGEAVMAVIKLREGFTATEEDIFEHCKKTLSSYKKPRRVAFVDIFPMNDVGKVQKFKLREQYAKAED